VSYSFLVTNTGNVTLTSVGVVEIGLGLTGTGTRPVVTCPGDGTLAPGAQVTCTASYTVTQQDMDAGTITDVAVAHGTHPTGRPAVSRPSTAVVTTSQGPALTVVKSASPTTVTSVGQTVSYSFLVTNTGNVTLSGIAVREAAFSGSGTPPVAACPVPTLAPGAQVTCTAAYQVTSADLTAGSLTDTAVADGLTPSGGQVVSPPSSALVTTVRPRPSPIIVPIPVPFPVWADQVVGDHPGTGGEGVVLGGGVVAGGGAGLGGAGLPADPGGAAGRHPVVPVAVQGGHGDPGHRDGALALLGALLAAAALGGLGLVVFRHSGARR